MNVVYATVSDLNVLSQNGTIHDKRGGISRLRVPLRFGEVQKNIVGIECSVRIGKRNRCDEIAWSTWNPKQKYRIIISQTPLIPV